MPQNNDKLVIAGREFDSRLMVGTGKYADFNQMVQAIEASGAQIITVAVRRVNISDRSKESLLDHIDLKKYTLLPNTVATRRTTPSAPAAWPGKRDSPTS
jgi:thiazole synthase